MGARISFLLENDHSPILKSVGGSLSKYKYVDIVFTVSPGWTRHQYDVFENSISLAIVYRFGQRVWLVSEPECVLLEGLQQRTGNGDNGDIILVTTMGPVMVVRFTSCERIHN